MGLRLVAHGMHIIWGECAVVGYIFEKEVGHVLWENYIHRSSFKH